MELEDTVRRRLKADNADLLAELERMKAERDRFRKESAMRREEMVKLGSTLVAREKELYELQSRHDDVSCELGDLRAEVARTVSSKAPRTSWTEEVSVGTSECDFSN